MGKKLKGAERSIDIFLVEFFCANNYKLCLYGGGEFLEGTFCFLWRIKQNVMDE